MLTNDLQMFFLATMSTVTVVSNWSFRSFRNRLNQQDFPQSHHPPPSFSRQSSGQYHPQISQGQFHGYMGGHQEQTQTLAAAPNLEEKQNAPFLLEHPRSRDFVTERSRERESRQRTPSPVKRRNLL